MSEPRYIVLTPDNRPCNTLHDSPAAARAHFVTSYGKPNGHHFESVPNITAQREAWRFWRSRGYRVVPATLTYRTT